NYNWTGPNGFTANTRNITLENATVTMNGDYIATATDINGCYKKDTVTVTVRPMPGNTQVGSNSPLCVGSILQLSSATSSQGVIHTWKGPGNFTATTQNTGIHNVAAAATGWYTITF